MELAEELGMDRREVISRCMEMGVPIFDGHIDRALFLAALDRHELSHAASKHDWIHVTSEQLAADPGLAGAIARFRAPPTRPGKAAENWLKGRALRETEHVATYILQLEGEVAAFYSLGMSEVELRTQHRKQLSAAHPRQGAVLILWLARSDEAGIDGETVVRHAVGISQIGARHVGAAVIALDPYDADTERYWREQFGFRASLTRRVGADGRERPRLWMPLFPGD